MVMVALRYWIMLSEAEVETVDRYSGDMLGSDVSWGNLGL